MPRADILHACFELFSGATEPIPDNVYLVRQKSFQYGTWAIPGVRTIVKGEVLDNLEQYLPVLFLTVPPGTERRAMTGWKFVTYTVTASLADMPPGQSKTVAGGAQAVYAFYQTMDQVSSVIRGTVANEKPKQLITPSYPSGAAIRFGEDVEFQETHRRMENTVLIDAQFLIKCTEQVSA